MAQTANPLLQQGGRLLGKVTGVEVRNYSTRDFGREKYEGAVSALVAESKAESNLAEIRRQLPQGLVAYIGTTNSLSKPKATGVEIVIGPGSSPLDVLEIAQTDAVNYGMVTQDLRRKLEQWHKEYGIDIWQAETDTIQLKLLRLPKNTGSFAKEVYTFCPDIVDQGVGTIEALEKTIREQRSLFLWWD